MLRENLAENVITKNCACTVIYILLVAVFVHCLHLAGIWILYVCQAISITSQHCRQNLNSFITSE